MAFDPANPTFYGACLQVRGASDVAGNAIAAKFTGAADNAAAMRYLYEDTDCQWLDPGDRALVSFYPERGLLTLEDHVDFHVVLEFRSDSTGTLRLSAGDDPTWELTDPARASEPLGTVTATGQVVVPVSSWSGAMVWAGETLPILQVEALTGQPRIAQVRVRMWPAGGIAGGSWESDPDYAIEHVKPRFMVSNGSADISDASNPAQYLGGPGPENHNPGPGTWGGFDDTGPGSFDEMRSFLQGHGIQAYQAFGWYAFTDPDITGSYSFWWTLQEAGGHPSHDWRGRFGSGMVLIVADPVPASTRQGGGPVFPDPDRVPGESAAGIRDGRTGGPLESIFTAWTDYPELSVTGSANDLRVGVRTFTLSAEPWDETVDTGLDRLYFSKAGLEAQAGPPPDPPDATHVDIPNAAIVGIEVNGTQGGALSEYELEVIPAGYTQAVGSRRVSFDKVRATHRFEAVQWYNPAAASAPTRKPRFFVTFTEVDADPREVSHVVGIGKPADDASIFKVPTPLGTLRELRHGEKVSDVSVAYPLKVKLEDGSWTVVAGMTPDD